MPRDTSTKAIPQASQDKEALEEKIRRTMEYLQKEVWPHIPPEDRGTVLTKEEQEEILGIGPNGYPE